MVGMIFAVVVLQNKSVQNLAATFGGGGGSFSNAPAINETNSSFADATTTLAAVLNPYQASSTVEASFTIQNGTTTIAVHVGTSTTPYPATIANVSPSLVPALEVATGTSAHTFSGVTVGSVGYKSPGATSMRTIEVGPTDYVVFYATNDSELGSVAGITNTNNTFSGTYKLRWSQ